MSRMRILLQSSDYTIEVPKERNIRQALDLTSFRVRSGCRGIGACGLCKIKVISGELTEPTENEKLNLSAEELEEGIRLACQTRCLGDATIEIVNPAPKSAWRSLPQDLCYLAKSGVVESGEYQEGYGIAVDMGTTNISIALLCYRSGKVIAIHTGHNPQAKYGSDVISRIDAAIASADDAHNLEILAIEAIREGLNDLSVREGIPLEQVRKMTIVGNTAMLSLLCNDSQTKLVDPSQWDKPIDIAEPDYERWCRAWGVPPQTSIDVIPPLAGFIGSDLLAGMVATGLQTFESPSLLIDFGTNSESVLVANGSTWATSSSGGPAFEGMGLSCGMPAMAGAIYRSGFEPKTQQWHFDVIDSDDATGICGSGLVNLLALLLK
ncbi:MAG: ASKHA domain-containing protein, partial [Sulfurimonadaceae bacterium]|nr:ASKHA domain-containing protein [Sulfurimonadaceae bacterium]